MREWLNDLIVYGCQLALCESFERGPKNKGQSRHFAIEDRIV